jgi:hypothetical protein
MCHLSSFHTEVLGVALSFRLVISMEANDVHSLRLPSHALYMICDETTTACSFEQCCPDVPLSLGLVAGHRKSLVEPREGEDGDVLAKTAIDSSECCTGRGSV